MDSRFLSVRFLCVPLLVFPFWAPAFFGCVHVGGRGPLSLILGDGGVFNLICFAIWINSATPKLLQHICCILRTRTEFRKLDLALSTTYIAGVHWLHLTTFLVLESGS